MRKHKQSFDYSNHFCGTCLKFENKLTPAVRHYSNGTKKKPQFYCEKHYKQIQKNKKLNKAGISVKKAPISRKKVVARMYDRKNHNSAMIIDTLIEQVILKRDPHFRAGWFPVREEKGRWVLLWLFEQSRIKAYNEFPVDFVKRKKMKGLFSVCADIGLPDYGLFIECKRNVSTCMNPTFFNNQMKQLETGVKKRFPSGRTTAYSQDGSGPAKKNIKSFLMELKEFFNTHENQNHDMVKFNEISDEMLLVLNTLDFYFTDLRKLIVGKL